MFGEEPDTNGFYLIDEDEQIKILKECIEREEPIYENKYFIEHYMEEVV
jgi:hypothetical protein